jgi:hypothetical protein
MRECTFTPQVQYSQPPPSNAAVNIKGLDKHLEMREYARKLEEEKKERQVKAFKPRYVAPPHQLITVPQPFELKTSQQKITRFSVSNSLSLVTHAFCDFSVREETDECVSANEAAKSCAYFQTAIDSG